MMTIEDNTWKVHLEKMTGFAQLRRQRHDELRELAKDDVYIRVGGNGFRPVSLHGDNPCGSLYIDCKAVGTTANLDRALQRARSAGHGKGKAGNGKPEHRVQAGLIREALMAPASLPKMLDCEALLDQLIFVSDEFRLDDIRADVIALGRKGDDYFPVLIELKAVRSLTRVLEQLERITDRLNQAPEATVAFFSAASGVDASRIGTSALRMLIWPASKSGKESHAVSIARDRGFVTIAFPIENDGRLKFQREV